MASLGLGSPLFCRNYGKVPGITFQARNPFHEIVDLFQPQVAFTQSGFFGDDLLPVAFLVRIDMFDEIESCKYPQGRQPESIIFNVGEEGVDKVDYFDIQGMLVGTTNFGGNPAVDVYYRI